MADEVKKRPKTINIFGKECRLISPIKCDFCGTPQIKGRKTCDGCGSMYCESDFDVNDPPNSFGWFGGGPLGEGQKILGR